ncbi:hypothetical protein CPB83DRAFT_836411 [Crepidotus variabilis]|uniref:Uncharacterized protein n=1 Tax=Crepidotus variabilis TaxID=179855 RepID=A0A9P6EEJ0_9AGAR|nr:hypothetical protein CPB83DRAFT_836411 [Crepidotus variabilis]
MSFYSSTAYKPQIRQEGFTPMNSNGGGGGSPDGGPSADLFNINSHFLDGPVSRKQTTSSSSSNMDFTDELASFIGTAATEKNGHGHHHQQHQQHLQQHNPYAQDDRPYNIFDTSAPPGASAALNGGAAGTNGNQPGAHPSSVSSTTSGFSVHSEYHPHQHPPPPFNSTLPALNSSMRYEPHPDPPYNPRHTPSPIHSQAGVHSPILPPPPPPHVANAAAHHHHQQHQQHHPHTHTQNHINSRSRSRSRPPTSSSSNEGGSAANGVTVNPAGVTVNSAAGGIGPARTTRTRRNNSVSSTSPPPYGRPHAIVIPGSRGAGSGNGNWFVSSQSSFLLLALGTPPPRLFSPLPISNLPFLTSSPTSSHLLSPSASHKEFPHPYPASANLPFLPFLPFFHSSPCPASVLLPPSPPASVTPGSAVSFSINSI